MVDVRRSYRRWFAYRLAILVPCFLSAIAVVLWISLGSNSPPWLRVATTTLALLVDMLLGYLLFQTLTCALFQHQSRRREARILRGLLAWSRTAALASVGLLWALALVPQFFSAVTPRSHAHAHARARVRAPRASPPVPMSGAETPVPTSAVEDVPLPAGPRAAPSPPEIHPVVADLPTRLELGEGEFFASPEQEPGPGELGVQENGGDEERTPRFGLRRGEVLRLEIDLGSIPGFDRPWLPDERDPEALPPVEVRIEALSLDEHEGDRAGAMSLSFDLPVGPSDSIRAAYLLAFLGEPDEAARGKGELRDEHATLEYVRRLAGYTRRSSVDLAVSVGLSFDRYFDPSDGAPVDDITRVSPHFGLELTFLQSSLVSFGVRAGQTVPANLTGGTASVTDLAAVVRVAVSEHVSFTAGYRILFVHLRDFDHSLSSSRASDDFDRKLAGPLVGLEVRF